MFSLRLWTQTANDGGDVIPIATPTAGVIARMLVATPEDLPMARALQRAITVTTPNNHPHERTVRAGRPTAIADTGIGIYSEIGRFAAPLGLAGTF